MSDIRTNRNIDQETRSRKIDQETIFLYNAKPNELKKIYFLLHYAKKKFLLQFN